MEDQKESILTDYPNVISYECTKEIIEQMEKCICKIKVGQEQGTGFFCKIPFPDKNNMLPVFITNNHLINEKILNKDDGNIEFRIQEEKEMKKLEFNNRKKYTNAEYDITIIEIKEIDNIINYLELDNKIIDDIIKNDNSNNDYIDKTIYIIQYPEGDLSVSYGILKSIFEDKKYNFIHKCSTKGGSSGSPILTTKNNKIIGIHKEGHKTEYNKGAFLNFPLKEFIKYNFNKKNEIENEVIHYRTVPNNVIPDKFIPNIPTRSRRKAINFKNLSKLDSNEINKLNLNYDKICVIKELKEFNKKYNVNITSNKNLKISLNFKMIENEGLKDLCQITFTELQELDLYGNNISDIKILEKAQFEKLENLFLNNNKITDINIFEKVNFKELKELYLHENKISDIKVLERVKFEKLEILNLGDNNLSDINIFEKVNFKELKKLYLYKNNISDISILENVKFERLESLNLSNNNISEINSLEKANFQKLKNLNLNHNKIEDIKVLEKVKFKKVKILELKENFITDINILEKVNFKVLKKLDLSFNNISDIQALKNMDLENLEILFLNGNKIDLIENQIFISELKSKIALFWIESIDVTDSLNKI